MPKVGGKNIEVLFSAETIAERNLELATAIVARNFENLLVISILKGSFIFAADLIRAMHDAGAEPDVEFITVSSYGKGTESTEVRLAPRYRQRCAWPRCASDRRYSRIREKR